MTIFGVRRAAVSDIGDVLAVLDEAAAWLRAQGVQQWPPHFRREWIEPAVREGNTWLAGGEDGVLGTVTLDWADPLWADRPACAAYVHRLAVRRSAAGLGAWLLDWAADTAVSAGRGVLRLDCVASNGRLRSYYEAAGFRHCDDALVGGPPGSRGDGPGVAVSRYERQVPARAR